MSDLLKAYTVLGLEPGSSKDDVQKRYKRLAMVWHPDRFPTSQGQTEAEEELKKILTARDLLLKHFDSGRHQPTACECSRAHAGGADTQPRQRAPEPGQQQPSGRPGQAAAAGNSNQPK